MRGENEGQANMQPKRREDMRMHEEQSVTGRLGGTNTAERPRKTERAAR